MTIKIELDTGDPNRVADIAQVIESVLGLLPEQAIVVVDQGEPNQDPAMQDGITVRSQDEFDAASEKHRDNPNVTIVIDAPSHVWIRLTGSHRCGIEARNTSRVEAWDSSRVTAWDSSRVEAYDESRVWACDSASVVAWDSSSVEAWDSASVRAYEESRVVACDSASVVARDSSSVEAWGSSSVVARGSSRVETYDQSSVDDRRNAR